MRTILPPLLLIAVCASAVLADTAADGRSAWLLERAAATSEIGGEPQSEIGGEFGASGVRYEGTGTGVLKPMIMSAVLPGLGEASMGYMRGYFMMAVDIASWIGVKHYHDQGNDTRSEYYAYADAHWSETRLADAYGPDYEDYPGTFYYRDVTIYDDPEHGISLWVSKVDDRREYYENLGKWDQFVFGWDDFRDPRLEVGTDANSTHLKDNDYRVSAHRMAYRALREEANDQFDKRDRLIYLNMFTRVFSMFQVAYLSGVFSDGEAHAMSIGDHDVVVLAEPRGLTGGRLGFAISY